MAHHRTQHTQLYILHMFSYVRSFHCTPPRRPSAETRRAHHRVGTAGGESLRAIISNMLLVSSLVLLRLSLRIFMHSICGCGAAAACQVNAESQTTTTQNQGNDDDETARRRRRCAAPNGERLFFSCYTRATRRCWIWIWKTTTTKKHSLSWIKIKYTYSILWTPCRVGCRLVPQLAAIGGSVRAAWISVRCRAANERVFFFIWTSNYITKQAIVDRLVRRPPYSRYF